MEAGATALTNWSAFGWACFGGAVIELVSTYQIRQQRGPDYWPEWSKQWRPALLHLALVVSGGITAVAYLESMVPLTALLSMHIGASLPAIILQGSQTLPPLNPGDRVN